jgi:SNF2 family DNA or RNA helicase
MLAMIIVASMRLATCCSIDDDFFSPSYHQWLQLLAIRASEEEFQKGRFEEALRVITESIAVAEKYNADMSALMKDYEAKFSKSKQPKSITGGRLREYQLEGFRWLLQKYIFNESGIIADEMGLGKTRKCG